MKPIASALPCMALPRMASPVRDVIRKHKCKIFSLSSCFDILAAGSAYALAKPERRHLSR